MDLSRRKFISTTGTAGALSFLAANMSYFPLMAAPWERPRRNRVSWLAYRSTSFEGEFQVRSIEGQIPTSLNGSLYRVGPGTKEATSTSLKHFFDGDAYLTRFHFQNGELSCLSRFIQTPERQAEQSQGKMLYNDFGTASPGRSKGYKNPPNIHVQNMGGKLLAFSEAAAPIAVDGANLDTLGAWNFNGSLPKQHTFTAHSRKDPLTGTYYTFGITQGLSPALKVYRLNSGTGKLELIKSHSLGGFYLVHDMILTENHIVLMVPPVYVDLMGAAQGNKPIAELLRYESQAGIRILVMRKDGAGKVMEFNSKPSGMTFHNCNAYEENGKIILDAIISSDASVFDLFKNWDSPSLPAVPASNITRLELDLASLKVLSRTSLSDGRPTDFPCLNPSLMGQKGADYFCLEAELGTSDPLAFQTLAKWNAETREVSRVSFDPTTMLGEPVFIDQSGSHWITHLGYSSSQDESFLDIRRASDLGLEARIWLGRYLPLGFHGSFVD